MYTNQGINGLFFFSRARVRYTGHGIPTHKWSHPRLRESIYRHRHHPQPPPRTQTQPQPPPSPSPPPHPQPQCPPASSTTPPRPAFRELTIQSWTPGGRLPRSRALPTARIPRVVSRRSWGVSLHLWGVSSRSRRARRRGRLLMGWAGASINGGREGLCDVQQQVACFYL
jgi:hypothetical protein